MWQAKYNLDNEVEEDEMDGVCSTNAEKRNAYRLFVGKSHQKDQDVGGWIILR
jgi:hypothetical protein